jgi:hypothetical protein
MFKSSFESFNVPDKIKLMLSSEPSKRPKITDIKIKID